MHPDLHFSLFAAALVTLPLQAAVDSQTALDAHNEVRTLVNQGSYAGQPVPDPELARMMWDPSLAASAATYAQQCIWAHSSDRINTGENLYASTNLTNGIEKAVATWAEEYRYYDFSTRTCTPGEQCGHYTQLVWQDSILVGCADAVCTPLRNPDGSVLFDSARHQVCHYATAGNITGHDPYEIDGGTASLVPGYSEDTGVLTLPYGLIWPPTNVVQPTTASFSVHSSAPLTFALDSHSDTPYRAEEEHAPIFDTNGQRLFLPNVDTYIGGRWGRHSAVLERVPGSTAPILLQLEYAQ